MAVWAVPNVLLLANNPFDDAESSPVPKVVVGCITPVVPDDAATATNNEELVFPNVSGALVPPGAG